MSEIIWLSHGGPGSGRYPKGSGKKYLKKHVKKLNKLAIGAQFKRHEYNEHYTNASRISSNLTTKDLSYKKRSRLEKRLTRELDKHDELEKQFQEMSKEYDKILKNLLEKMDVKLTAVPAIATRQNIWKTTAVPYLKMKVAKK